MFDGIQVLRRAAGLQPYSACIDAGNVKCDDDIDAVDSLYIMEQVAGQTVNLPVGCPSIGSQNTVETTLTQAASPGDTEIQVASQNGLAIGDQIRIDAGTPEQEDNEITGFGSVLLAAPLQYAHGIGAPVISFKKYNPGPPVTGPIPNVRFYTGTGPLPLQALPPETSPGDPFTFTLEFKNAGTSLGYNPYIDLLLPTMGIDDESQSGPCDGIWFEKADALFVSPATQALITIPPTGSKHTVVPTNLITPAGTNPPIYCGSAASVSHIGLPVTPFGPHPFGGTTPPIISTTPQAPGGYEWVVIKLPFTSYGPSQGITYVNVTAHLSSFADANQPLQLLVRGGFQLGATPAGTPPIPIEQSYFDQRATDPTPFTIKKVCTLLDGTLCPEDETATGPNFPMDYVITVDIDAGLTINNLTVQDILPDNVKYDDHLSIFIGGALPNGLHLPTSLLTANSPPCQNQPPTANFPIAVSEPTGPNAGGLLVATLCSPITGTSVPDDIVITFQFYIPALDANGVPILDSACDPVKAINDVNASGDWLSPDPRDGSVLVISDITPKDHTLYKKCIAIQKTFTPLVVIPGDTINYTLNFQISDYLQMNKLVITDLLSDGQHYVPGSAELTVADKTGALTTVTPQFDQYATAVANPLPCPGATPWPFQQPGGLPHIGTTVTFGVSAALAILYTGPPASPTLSAGIMTGGQILPTPPTTPGATGQITFQTTVQDAFDCPVFPGADQYVDKFDVLYDYATITGDVIQRADGSPLLNPFATATDVAGAKVPVAGDTVKKCIYSIERPAGTFVVGPPASGECAVEPTDPAPQITPGDVVTFSILKTIPTGDHEGIDITDFLPSPIMQPAPITYGQGSSNTCPIIHGGPPGIPVPNPPSIADNSITFHYPPGYDTNNQPCVIDILLGVTVAADPYADAQLISNAVQECEQNSLGGTICQTAIAPMQLTEPRLRITKGAVAACQPDPANLSGKCVPPVGTFINPSLAGQVPFNPWNAAFPWGPSTPYTPNITSNVLAANPIISDVNADAGDVVTFAVIVENYGTGVNGAFAIKINDTIPAGLTIPPTSPGYNFSVHDGTGLPLACVGPCTTNDFFGPGITLFDPTPTTGALAPYDLNNGHNIAVITYSLQVKQTDLMGNCYTNTASIIHYAGTPTGPNHFGTPFGGPYSDIAKVCIMPTIAKSIVKTSEAHTAVTPINPWTGGVEELAIGEIIRYRLDIGVPEGSSIAFQVKDILPPGLAYMPGGTTSVSVTNTSSNGIPPFGAPLPSMNVTNVTGTTVNCGLPGIAPIFNFGSLANNDHDADTETMHIEFNALVCNVLVNQDGTLEDNYAQVSVRTKPIKNSPIVVITSNTVRAVIVEPKITITKSVLAGSQPSTWDYTIDLHNTGSADAFEVHLTDPLPNCSIHLPPTLIPSTSPALTGVSSAGSTSHLLDVQVAQFPKGGSLQIKFTTECGTCLNTATVIWTSLPGTGTVGPPNTTGSPTPGGSGAINGERDGSLVPPLLNDYSASDSVTDCGKTRIDICKVAHKYPPGQTFDFQWGQGNLINSGTFSLEDGKCESLYVDSTKQWTIAETGPATPPGDVTNIVCTPAATVDEFDPVSGGGPFQLGDYAVRLAQSGTFPVLPPLITCTFTNIAKAPCDLRIIKDVNPNPAPNGQPVTITLTVTNVGTSPCTGITSVVDILPQQFYGTSVQAGSIWGCTALLGPPDAVFCSWDGSISPVMPGQTLPPIFITSTISPPPAGGSIQNCATVSNPNDLSPPNNPSNNTSCVTVGVTTLCTGTISIIKDTVPNDPQDFPFTAIAGLNPATFSLDDDNDPVLSNQQDFKDVACGPYIIREATPPVPPSWIVDPVVCTGATNSTVTPTANSVAITLAAGEHVICTFRNHH